MLSSIYVIYIFLAVTWAHTPLKRTDVAKPKADGIYYRLPTSVEPNEYLVILEPNFTNFTFEGYVEIDITVLESTTNITLHAAEITFIETTVFNGSVSVDIANEEDDATREFRILEFNGSLEPGDYTIKINYTGILNDNLRGFYKSYYTDADGITRYLGTTQFESTDARRAFPCFDEPALKANFTIQIIRESGYNAISNMPLVETQDLANGRQMDIFETSVKMSTYLVAFIVSDFEYVESGKQRVYSRPDSIKNGDANFALDVAITILDELEEYTGVPYSLEKMYQASIPQFSAGAMENWGLVTYRETALLFNKTTTTTGSKQSIEVVIAHEYTHQWFGDLVGPQWWSYLWLNEGFASYLQYIIGGKAKPTWRLDEQLVVANLHSAFSVDCLESTRPMTQDAQSPSEISALFDTIAYGKSGAVLRMLSHAITEEAFRKGLKNYLTERAYKAAESSHLWSGIQEAIDADYPDALPSGLRVLEIMSSWELQAGYPAIHVTRNYEDGSITISQERFLLYNATHSDTTKWYVPINYATASDPDYTYTNATDWLLPSEDLVLTLDIKEDDWILINKQAAGYYRINYDDTNWQLLADFLDSDDYTKISPLNRAQLIEDAFQLARSGRLSYKIALELTKYLHRETDYIPLYAFFRVLSYFNQMAAGGSNYDLFEKRLAEILDAAINELGVKEKEDSDDDEEHVNNLNRISVINYACRFGNTACREQTKARLADIDSITVDLQSNVLCGGLRSASKYEWEAVYSRSLTETSSTLKSALNSALGCSEDESILDSYVATALASNQSVFSNIYEKGNFGVRYVFNYLQNNLETVYEGLGNSSTGSVIRGIASYLTTQDQLEQLQELSESANSDLSSAFESAISTVNSNVAWTSVHLDDITQWISDELGEGESAASMVACSLTTILLSAFIALVR